MSRFSLAFDDGMLEPSPTWTGLDGTDNLIAGYSVSRGRTDEFQRTGTGSASVQINDKDGLFDPTNPGGAYSGSLDGRQAMLAIRNPVDSSTTTIFRGVTDEYDYTVDPSQVITYVSVPLVDGMDYLAGVEVTPSTAGDPAGLPAGIDPGNIWYDDTAGTVDDRIIQALADGSWPSSLTNIFSGNVSVQETVYPPRSTILQIIQDAADAEFPAVANFFMSKTGVATFHGRLARFDPGSYGLTTWKAGDGAAIAGDSSRAQIRALSFSRPRANIINAALATPQGIKDLAIGAQLVTDSTSIGQYGVRSWSAENLLTKHDFLNGLEANAATKLFATYYITNYAQPRTRVTQLVFRGMRPDDPRAAATWALIEGVEISDLIDLKTSHPGGGGFNEPFFVEGIHYDVRPLNPEFDDVTLTLDVSPASYYTIPF